MSVRNLFFNRPLSYCSSRSEVEHNNEYIPRSAFSLIQNFGDNLGGFEGCDIVRLDDPSPDCCSLNLPQKSPASLNNEI